MANSNYQVEKLNPDNYASWSIQIRSLLITQDLYDVLELTLNETATAQEKAAWIIRDRKALATITLAVRSSELIHLKDCKSAKEAWCKLENIYRAKDPTRKVNLFKQFVRFKFTSDEKYGTQINKYFSLVDDLRNVDINFPDEILSIFLLCSLPPELENFVVAIESRDVLPSIEQLKNKILEVELRRNDNVSVGKEQVCAIKNKKSNFNKNASNLNSNQSRNKDVKCFQCGKKGHIKSQCFSKNKVNNVNSAMLVVNSCMNDQERNEWILDSGASSHVCGHKELFTGMKEYNSSVVLASGDKFQVSGIGEVEVKFFGKFYTLMDVLYIPDMKSNFLSISKMAEKGYSIIFTKNKVDIFKHEQFQFNAMESNGIYKIKSSVNDYLNLTEERSNNYLWHKRFGHLNANDLKKLERNEMVRGLKGNIPNNFNCITCSTCKMSAKPFKQIGTTVSKGLLELVHTDICWYIPI